MVTISIFFGIIIRMSYREHPPPHIHAIYQGYEAVFEIETGVRLHGTFPSRA